MEADEINNLLAELTAQDETDLLEEQESDNGSDFSEGDEENPEDSGTGGVEVEDIEALVTDVQDHVFGELRMPYQLVQDIQNGWQAFITSQGSRDAVGEAIYAAIFDAAPELQHLFKTARSIMAMKFVVGLNSLITELGNPAQLKVVTEMLSFQHLDIQVTGPRAAVFRDAIVELLEMELGSALTPQVKAGFQAILNYSAGAMIYVRREYSDRIQLLRTSWLAAMHARLGQDEEKDFTNDDKELEKFRNDEGLPDPNSKRAKKIQATKVPENFNEMFLFNAAVMGFHTGIEWMMQVLDQFENMVLNASNVNRLQEECDVLALRLIKIKEPIVFSEFKAIMLASLRSLVPKVWGVEHEVAWTWFWDNLERMIKAQIGQLKGQQRAVERFIRNLSEESVPELCRDVYRRFFEQTPSGQNYFKQSTTRLYFIAGKVLELCMEIYQRPRDMVEDISALGLRHVGYGILTEHFSPFVEAWSQAIYARNVDEKTCASLRWSLTLISKTLVRTIIEGSTLVMRAINTNSANKFKKAIMVTARNQREQELLKVTVGTQSISPLYWAIKSGAFNVARAMITDLLTIRADRDNYYFGCDALFERHPDILQECCAVRGQKLLPTLFDGLIWRSRSSVKKLRRVNFFVKHLIQNSDNTFNTYLPAIVKLNDPKLIGHPVVSFVFNLLWTHLARYYFLRSRLLFLFLVLMAVTSQSILPRINPRAESDSQRIALFICRVVLYFVDLLPQLLEHVRLTVRDCKQRSLFYVGGFVPAPAYLNNLPRVGQLALIFCMLLMFIQEPILACFSNMHGDFAGSGLFTTHCPEAERRLDAYSVVSELTVLLHWALLVDLCIFSLRFCCYFLTCSRVLVELHHYGSAVLFIILAFSCGIGAFGSTIMDFDSIPSGALSLLKIVIGMFERNRFEALREIPQIYTVLVIFIMLTLVFLGSLLIAQIAGAYHNFLVDMQNYAVLFRSGITIDTVRSVRPKKWAAFLSSLGFEERIEFNEGDVGLAGGIQILEPANLNPTLVETVRRYGGSTSVDTPWPDEDALDRSSLEARLKHIEKLLVRATKAMTGEKKVGSEDSQGGSSASFLGSSAGAGSSASAG